MLGPVGNERGKSTLTRHGEDAKTGVVQRGNATRAGKRHSLQRQQKTGCQLPGCTEP